MTQPSAPVSGSIARSKRGWFLLAVLFGMGVVLWLGSVQNALRARARNPYPQTQNGLVFVAQHNAHNPTITNPVQQLLQWINHLRSGGAYVAETDHASIEIGLPPGTTAEPFSAVARASNGDTFGLRCEEMLPSSSTFTSPSHFFVSLTQPGVPETYQWLDITVDDKKGHRGTWRVFDLPPLRHALLPTTSLHETETVQKVSVQARAWWDAKSAPPQQATLTGSSAIPVVVELKADAPPASLSRPSQSWGVQIESVTPEWDDLARIVPFSKGGTSGLSSSSSGRSSAGAGSAHSEGVNAVAPHPAAQHLIQIEAKLTQYDATQELVTFHNLPLEPDNKGWRIHLPPGGLWEETPSGVRVLLTPPSAPSPTDDPMKPNDVRVSYRLTPQNTALPNSVLQQRVGMKHPLRLSANVEFSGIGISTMLSGNAPNGIDQFARLTFTKPITRPVLPQLAIYVNQEAELQRVPVTFIVPVKAGKPKQKWE